MRDPKKDNPMRPPAGPGKVDMSVVICTRNRCELLQRTVELLARQSLGAGKTFEIIVVDNDSSDATKQVVTQLQKRTRTPLIYTMERKTGLSRARNRGLQEAKGEIIVFTDDDMVFPENWLERIHMDFATNPPPACVTGPVTIHEDSHPALKSSFPPGKKRFLFPSEPWEVGRGNNMAFKRSYLVKAGPFDTRLGAGTPAASGEDTDMFYRIMKLGGDILFDPELSSYHDHGRHDPQAIRMICRNYAVGGTAFLVKHVVRFDVFALKLLLWKYESFRLAARRSRMDTRFNPPMNEVKKIYVKGYFAGIRMGIANLFRKAD